MSLKFCTVLPVAALLAGLAVSPALAQDAQELTLTIKNHVFEPATLTVPAGKKVTVIVQNQDPTTEEFESHDLKIEKIVAGGKQIKVVIGPLKPGEYAFVGEHHEETAKGTIVVK
jgi:plastocyanin